MRSRANIIVVVCAAVLAVLLVISAVLLLQGMRKYSTAEKTASRLFQKLAQHYDDNPFPSPPNVEIKENNANQLREWADRLVTEMKKDESRVVEKSPPLFMRRLGDTRNSMLALAEKQGVTLKPQFAFGFEQYLGEAGMLPSPAVVPQLTHQLVAISSIVHVLVENSVTSIESIQRTDLESATEPATGGAMTGAVRPPPRARPVRSTRPQMGVTPPESAVEGEEPLYTTERLVLEFRAREDGLVRVLNALAAMPLPVSVDRIEFRRDGAEVVIPPLPTVLPGVDAAAPVVVPQTELVHSKRVVSGVQVENPMLIRLELNIFRFSKEGDGEIDQ